MGLISPTRESASQPRGGEELDVTNVLTAILNVLNGNVDAANITDGSITNAELAAAAKNLFPQLVSAADRKINFGSGAFPSFANTKHATQTQAHGLGRTPVAAFVLPQYIDVSSGSAAQSAIAVSYTSFDATNLVIRGSIVDGVSNNAAGYLWLAIG